MFTFINFSLNTKHHQKDTSVIHTNNTMNKLLFLNWTQMCQIYFYNNKPA